MLRKTALRRDGLQLPSGEEISNQILGNRLRQRSHKLSFRALTAHRLQGWIAVAGIIGGAALFLGPWLVEEYRELLGYKFQPVPPTAMPRMSPQWWENEWRKANINWRSTEAKTNFFMGPFDYVKEVTKRNLYSAAAFRSDATAKDPVRALVPLCGDSPIIRVLAERGYDVDAVDSSESAMRACVEKTEQGLPLKLFDRIHLHLQDFFSPTLWEKDLKDRKYDVIYERLGMTSLNRDQRPDYCYLLKQALRDDGVIYIEGEFRTGRVKNNKFWGPPYSLSYKELQHHFPENEGYAVRCQETTDAIASLSRENRVLNRVPKELYVTPFHCVVFREKSLKGESLDERAGTASAVTQ